MQKPIYSALLSSILLTGCASPLGKVSNASLQERLSKNYQIAENPSSSEENTELALLKDDEFLRQLKERQYEISPNRFSEEELKPSMGKALFSAARHIYFDRLVPGDILYEPYQIGQKITKAGEEFLDNVLGNGIKLRPRIKGDEVGFFFRIDF